MPGGLGPAGRGPCSSSESLYTNSPRIFDVMHMKSLRKIIPPEFSDVMIAYVVGGEARGANPTNYEK